MLRPGTLITAVGFVLLAATSASAQRRITGRVTATTGEPVISASVNIQGTALGANTLDDGRFAIASAPAGSLVLVVKRIGYKRVTRPVPATQDVIDLTMEKDVLELERQIVTGTTTTISSTNAANGVAVVTGEQLNRVPTTTLEHALAGKVAGAVISQNSGAPGGGAQIQLRGVTSINASSSPLFVVDGVLIDNSEVRTGLNGITAAGGGLTNSQDQPANRVADLNPADIESIEVLKGASAGAIFGSKASNGVIVITTRRGQAGKPSANIVQRVGQFSLSHKLGFRCYGSAAEVTKAFDSDAAADFIANGSTCHDFEDQFYSGNPLSYETGLSVRGGGGTTTYFINGLAKRDNAIQQNTYFQKQSISGSLSQAIGARLTIAANNSFVHSLTDRGISGNDNNDIVSPGDVFSSTPTWIDLAAGGRNPYLSAGTNPFQTANLVRNPEDVYRYIGSVNTSVSLLATERQTLGVTLIGGVDAFSFNSHLTSPPDAYFEANDGLAGTIVTNKRQNVNANLNLSMAHKFITAPATASTSLGMRQERRQWDQVTNQSRNNPLGVTDVNLGVVQTVGETQSLIKDVAYFAQEELLLLNERLLLSGAINAERSSVNGDDHKFFTYPKAALSYRLPFEGHGVDEAKLRIAYGRAGNQPPVGFKFTALPFSVFSAAPGVRPSTIAGNAEIRPETSTELEGGVDAQFLRGRVALDVTVFRTRVEDLILTAAVSASSGFATKYINGGTMQKTGTELGLNVTPIQNSMLTWISRTTYANVDGRITRLDVPCFNAGSAFSTAYGSPYICQGYSPSTVQARNGFDSTFSCGPAGTCTTGTFVSRARRITAFESAPNFSMGFSNEVSVRSLRLSTLLEWRSGGKVANLTNNYFDFATSDTLGALADTATAVKRIYGFRRLGTSYLEDAGFLKLREVALSYTLPRALVNGFSSIAQDVRIELSGRNLKTWTPYTGYDPEVSNFSNQAIGRLQDVTPFPPSRSFFLSLSANF